MQAFLFDADTDAATDLAGATATAAADDGSEAMAAHSVDVGAVLQRIFVNALFANLVLFPVKFLLCVCVCASGDAVGTR